MEMKFNPIGHIALYEDKRYVIEQSKDFTYILRDELVPHEKISIHKSKVEVTKEKSEELPNLKTYKLEELDLGYCVDCKIKITNENKIKLKGDKYRDVCRECHGKRVRAGKLNNEIELVVNADNIVLKSNNFTTFTTQNIISNPSHYNSGEIDLIEAWYRLYPWNEFVAIMESQIMKYAFRNRKKGKPLEDLNKAAEYKRRLEAYYQRRQNND